MPALLPACSGKHDTTYHCVYHGRTEKTGNKRMVFIDPMANWLYMG